ncbi:MAG TPA: hypothetical protein VIF62_30120 [Labilithrix sp.]
MRRALLALVLVACDNSATPGGRDGGALRACYTEAACDALHAGDRCYFAQPHAIAREGFCAPAERPCAEPKPYCSVEGKTVRACRFPAVPWTRAGACDDAAAR